MKYYKSGIPAPRHGYRLPPAPGNSAPMRSAGALAISLVPCRAEFHSAANGSARMRSPDYQLAPLLGEEPRRSPMAYAGGSASSSTCGEPGVLVPGSVFRRPQGSLPVAIRAPKLMMQAPPLLDAYAQNGECPTATTFKGQLNSN